jgi:dTDP-4-dehydrorhamnose 3,5-epimerase
MPFRFERLEIPGVVLIEALAFPDARGLFMETYKRSAFRGAGIDVEFVQDNYSHSTRGVLRGLHYQTRPHAQGKLVAVLRGRIFDVAVDLRRLSPTYGRWTAATLSAENRRMLYIPPGFAHGFCTLSPAADVIYKVTSEYAAGAERGIAWNDPDLAVAWPVRSPLLSPKDACLPSFGDADHDFVYEPAGR